MDGTISCIIQWTGAMLLVAAAGCQEGSELGKLQNLPSAVLQAGTGSASRTPLQNVVPSKAPTEPLQVRIEEERFLGDVARQLGVTVDAMLEWNKMADSALQPGQLLVVHTTRDLIDRFVARRERHKAARLATAEARHQEKLRKEAEARAAKRAKQVALRAKRHGGGRKLDSAAGGEEPTGVPLRPGEVRKAGTGHVRGVTLPAGLASGHRGP